MDVRSQHWQPHTHTSKRAECRMVFRILQQTPGLTLAELQRRAGLSYSQTVNRLSGMERWGWMAYEDDDGRLYPFAGLAASV